MENPMIEIKQELIEWVENIDDLETNIAAARSLGITGVHFQNPVQLKQDIKPLLRLS